MLVLPDVGIPTQFHTNRCISKNCGDFFFFGFFLEVISCFLLGLRDCAEARGQLHSGHHAEGECSPKSPHFPLKIPLGWDLSNTQPQSRLVGVKLPPSGASQLSLGNFSLPQAPSCLTFL